MKKILLGLIIILTSCSSTQYLVYNADVHLNDEKLYTNVLVFDKQVKNEIFFYDSDRKGHLLMGDVSLKNCSDTTIVKRWRHTQM